ncbi:MAG TPA: VOC family protein [Thermoanaerobaculia bacterium]|nr:VOC family protein [Thermoanaerobaculia bacterium]
MWRGILRNNSWLAAILLLTACTAVNPHIDHIMLGAANLDSGIRELEALTGIRAVYGGEHPHLGTHNALISLGPQTYLEVIAPRDGAKLDADLAGLTKLEHITPVGWAVGVSDMRALRRQLAKSGIKSTTPRPGSRKTPSGDVLRWELVDIEPSFDNAPFFIQWADMSKHPAKTSPGGCSLTSIELEDPQAKELTRIEQALGLNVAIHEAKTPAMSVTLNCAGKSVQISKSSK